MKKIDFGANIGASSDESNGDSDLESMDPEEAAHLIPIAAQKVSAAETQAMSLALAQSSCQIVRMDYGGDWYDWEFNKL